MMNLLVKNWRQKLGALLVATAIWYLVKMHLRRRGSIPPVYDFVPGQVMGDPFPAARKPLVAVASLFLHVS